LSVASQSIDPSLQPYVGLKKDKARFLAMNVDQQIETYLKVAAIPLKPPDYSLSPLIAVSNGDIGRSLTDRITHENNTERTADLVRLAGDYCYLNKSCRGQQFLEEAVRSAVRRIPNSQGDPYVMQSVKWVSMGVAGQIEGIK
jgi:hypothetical protein